MSRQHALLSIEANAIFTLNSKGVRVDTKMKNVELKNIDPDDVNDLLLKIEASFNIKFQQNELTHAQTFGEICDLIKGKLQLDHTNDCTTQQAFYKLRSAFISVTQVENIKISPETSLAVLLPRKVRRLRIL